MSVELAAAILSNSPRHFRRSWNGSEAKAWYCHINKASIVLQRRVELLTRKPWLRVSQTRQLILLRFICLNINIVSLHKISYILA